MESSERNLQSLGNLQPSAYRAKLKNSKLEMCDKWGIDNFVCVIEMNGLIIVSHCVPSIWVRQWYEPRMSGLTYLPWLTLLNKVLSEGKHYIISCHLNYLIHLPDADTRTRVNDFDRSPLHGNAFISCSEKVGIKNATINK